MNSFISKACLTLFVCPFFSGAVGNQGDKGIDVTFTGTLHKTICTIEAGAIPVEVELPSKSVKFYQKNNRSASVPFAVSLLDCYPDVMGKIVKLTFNASPGFGPVNVSGLSMLTPKGSGSAGLAIGIENNHGIPVSLGIPISAERITQVGDGSRNTFYFRTYTTVTQPEKVVPGPYEATATFTADYQ